MAIAFTNLGSSANPDINDGSDATSFSNSSWTPPTTGAILLFVHSRRSGGPDTPTISGNNLTWTLIQSVADTDSGQLSMFAAPASGATTGATTADFGSNTQVHCVMMFMQITGLDLSGGIAAAFVQKPTNTGASGTSGSITLSAAGNSANRPISCFWHLADEAVTHRTNWTEFDGFNGGGRSRGLDTQVRSDQFETTASASWSTSAKWCGIAAEIKIEGGYTLTAAQGSFALTGYAADLNYFSGDYQILAGQGGFAFAGQAAALTLRRLTAAQGSFTFTGQNAPLVLGQYVAPALEFIPRNAVTYEIWLSDQYGERLALLDNIVKFDIVRVANDIGQGSFLLPGNFDRSLLELDHIIEVWRTPIGGKPNFENAYFLRYFEDYDDQYGTDFIKVGGVDGVDLLDRRIIAYAAGSAQAEDGGVTLGDSLWDVVDQNLGDTATDSDRDITDLGFRLAPNALAGEATPSIGKRFAWKKMLQVAKEIADWNYGLSRNQVMPQYLWFTVYPIVLGGGKLGWEFDVKDVYLGEFDTGWAEPQIIFSKEWGNLVKPKLVYDYRKEINYVYAGGEGQEDERTITEAAYTGRVEASIWNRRESFVDARNQKDYAQNKAVEKLYTNLPVVRFTGEIIDTKQLSYGIDWFFLSNVLAQYKGLDIPGFVKAVNLSVDQNGQEKLSAKFESALTIMPRVGTAEAASSGQNQR